MSLRAPGGEFEVLHDGRGTFRLGPVERWAVGLGALLVVGMIGGFAKSVNDRLDRLTLEQAEQAKAQAVTNQQLATLNALLANVPALSERVSRNEVRLESLERWRERADTQGGAP